MESVFKHPFWSLGFRPFFLFATGYAPVAMIVWLLWLKGIVQFPALEMSATVVRPSLWHAHEIIFGFAAAGLMGFLLTAVPNWTGTRPVQGLPLFLLVVLWLAGRIVNWPGTLASGALAAAIDVSVLAVALGFMLRAIIGSRNWRNLLPTTFVAVLVIGHVLYHWQDFGGAAGMAETGLSLSLNALLVLITIIGGRITPAFTANALGLQRVIMAPSRLSMVLNLAGVLAMIAVLVSELLWPGERVVGIAAAVAATANALRLARWHGHRTLHEPTLWVMHLAYAFLVLGLFLKAGSLLTDQVSAAAANHALGSGAIGLMILVVATRAALGHSGRPITATPAITSSFGLVATAALSRSILPELFPEYLQTWHSLAAVLWSAGFVVMFAVFLPIVLAPRADEK